MAESLMERVGQVWIFFTVIRPSPLHRKLQA